MFPSSHMISNMILVFVFLKRKLYVRKSLKYVLTCYNIYKILKCLFFSLKNIKIKIVTVTDNSKFSKKFFYNG